MIHLSQICLNFLDFFPRLGGKEFLWGKRNFGDCKRIFEHAVVEALIAGISSRLVYPQGSECCLGIACSQIFNILKNKNKKYL